MSGRCWLGDPWLSPGQGSGFGCPLGWAHVLRGLEGGGFHSWRLGGWGLRVSRPPAQDPGQGHGHSDPGRAWFPSSRCGRRPRVRGPGRGLSLERSDTCSPAPRSGSPQPPSPLLLGPISQVSPPLSGPEYPQSPGLTGSRGVSSSQALMRTLHGELAKEEGARRRRSVAGQHHPSGG